MMAGLTEIPAIIKPLSEKECFVISLIENFSAPILILSRRRRAINGLWANSR